MFVQAVASHAFLAVFFWVGVKNILKSIKDQIRQEYFFQKKHRSVYMYQRLLLSPKHKMYQKTQFCLHVSKITAQSKINTQNLPKNTVLFTCIEDYGSVQNQYTKFTKKHSSVYMY